MMDPLAQSSTAGRQPPSSSSCADDDTIATPPKKGDKSLSHGLRVEEKTLKFRFPSPHKSNDGNINPLVLHVHWMHEVQKSFGNGVQFFDNKNRKIGEVDPLCMTPDPQPYHFSVQNAAVKNQNNDESANTRFIIHRVQSKHSLNEIKQTPNVLKLMQKYDFYVNDHRWSETDWDTIQLGFFYGLDPQFYDLDQATCKLQEVFKQTLPRMKIPKFRLVYCSPKVRIARGNNRSIRTKAYAIETLRQNRDEMTHILKQAYKESGTFVPFQMRSRHPEAFEKMIRAQTHSLANNYVIILNHVGLDVMHYISDRILARTGVQAILPGKSVNTDGKYKILVHKSHYHATREYIMSELTSWINDHVAPDAQATLAKYPGPPEVAPIGSDGFSCGKQSYMTISVNTAFSIGSAISDSSPPNYVFQDKKAPSGDTSTLGGSRATLSSRPRTWADMASGRHTAATEISDIASPEGLDQSTIISDLASSRAEVENLRSQVAQLEAERAEHQKVLADTIQEQVSKAVQDQMSVFTVQMTQLFASLISTLHQTPGALPKRSANTLEVDGDTQTEQSIGELLSATSKRWDNKKTPTKEFQPASDTDNTVWQTPDSTPKQVLSTRGEQNLPQVVKKLSLLFSTSGEEGNMSQSEDDDINMRDSGIESTPKSLTSAMEVEAKRCNNDRD